MPDLLTANDRPGEYPDSWYHATARPLPPFPEAEGSIWCDVCIIGAGFTGLSAALHLAERGYKPVVLEAQRVGFGASGRNGGQVSGTQRLGQDTLEKQVGQETARNLWEISQASVRTVRQLAQKHGIDIAWRDGIIEANHKPGFVRHSHAYAAWMAEHYNYRLEPLSRDEIVALTGSEAYYGGTLDLAGGHIHPLRFAIGLAAAAQNAGARIYEGSRVTHVNTGKTCTIHTARATLQADHVVFACNGYLGELESSVARNVMPINNFIAATAPLPDHLRETILPQDHAVADSKFVINYFRLSEDHRMLFGGTESYGYRFPKTIAENVRKPMAQIYPQLADIEIDYAWGGTLGITMSRMPFFHKLAPNVLNASGYSGHGVALATEAGVMVAEMIAGQAERFDIMASVPSRPFPGGPGLRSPLLALAMLWYSLRDKL